ncbi:MAG: EmrB/QacA family drug resistance transporter [Sphingomonas sanxanigenens]|uniref:EmrB/QacA family drug resistance transporter n=1 Tax=Sphingomonas sanxanigenens TaxID=397260 RepID=A0A2W5BYF0_9SPHN|nr:MAG: EmrB/QacA family drug resistance transporter [Sphingomonas sanxanigenens]
MAAEHEHGAALQTKHRGILTVAVMMATVMQILDTTIANVALPHMQASLNATTDTITWVLTSYIVASAIAMPVTGWLSDRVGSRNLFIFSAIGFVAASMLCGIATGLEEMVLFRALQGISAAFINPLSQTVMLDINPPHRQASAMAVWGMGVMIGPIMGPVLGGWLTDNFDWRWCFYVNVPVGVVTVALLWWLLPSRPRVERRFDLIGFSLLGLALSAFQIMLDRGQQQDWFSSWEIVVEAGVAAAAAWMFVVHLLTAPHPMFDRAMLANRNLLTAMFFMLVTGLMMYATMALLPPMLQTIWDYPVVDTGVLLAPRGVGVLMSMWVAGRLTGKVDPRILIGTGMTVAAASLWQMTTWSLGMDWHMIVASGFIQGLGLGLVFMPLNMSAFATLNPRYRPEGASLLNLLRSIGSSAGISIVTFMLTRNAQTSHQDLAGHITPFSLPSIDPTNAMAMGGAGDSMMAMIDAEVNRQALMIAYLDDFKMMAIVTLVTIPLVMLLRRPTGPAAKPDPAHAVME